jgi:hypothetical protein
MPKIVKNCEKMSLTQVYKRAIFVVDKLWKNPIYVATYTRLRPLPLRNFLSQRPWMWVSKLKKLDNFIA